MPLTDNDRDAARYRKLRDYLIKNRIVRHYALDTTDSEPFILGNGFTGKTFEDAVDTLDNIRAKPYRRGDATFDRAG